MRLSCLPVTFFRDIIEGRMTIEAWIDLAASLRLDGVDFSQAWCGNLSPRTIAGLRARVADRGLQACMISCAPDFTHPEPAGRRATLDYMRRMLELATGLGVPLLRVTAGQAHPSVSRAQGVAWVCEGLNALLPEATAAGVVFAYENHTKATVWQYWDFSQDPSVFLEIVRAMEGTALRINFDTANPLVVGHDSLPLLRQVAHRVVSLHANDIRVRGQFDFCVVGQGIVPHAEIFRFLKREAGFDGWISIEEYSRTGEQGFRDAVRFVREAWAAA